MRRKITTLVMGALLLLIPTLGAVALAPAASGAPGVVVDLLAVPTSAQPGQSLSASARVHSASGNVTVQAITIAVRNSAGNQFDFPGATSGTVTPAGNTFTSAGRTFGAGTYDAFVAVQVGGAWYNLDPHRSFTVGGASSGVVVDSLTVPTSATASQSVSASARVHATGATKTVQAITVAVHGVGGTQADFPGAQGASVASGGYTFSSQSKQFAAGSYEAFVAVLINGTWYDLDPHPIFTVGAASGTPPTTTPTNNPLSFASEFNGPAGQDANYGLDKTYWISDDCWRNGCTGGIAQYQKDHALLDGAGNLVLTADTRHPDPAKCGSKACQYGSARLNMQDWNKGGAPTFAQAGGHFEAKMKLPQGTGLWPAFWTVGDQTDATGQPWPISGEIDILESLGNAPKTAFEYLHGADSGKVHRQFGGGQPLPSGTISDWHVYAVDWDPSNTGHITWSVDGTTTQTISAAGAGSAWKSFQGKHSVILNLAVGGAMPDSDSTAGTVFPAKMYVDYVRVYKNAMK